VQERKGVFAFGSNKNQNNLAPQVILASAVLDVPQAFLNVARRVKEKTFKAEIMRMGMKEGVVALAINPQLQNQLPQTVAARVEEAQSGILAGTVEVPQGF
jgi:basic membrane lipoprotein Med (substrate-binding protein (PBP1-ABC) superfamily)